MMIQVHTSTVDKVKMAVEPNKVLHTSPEILADFEKTLMSKYPTASEPTESIANDVSPEIFAFWPAFNNKMAAKIVTGKTIIASLVSPITLATAIAPNAT